MFERALQKSVELMLRAGTGVQAPLAAKYVNRLRRRHPDRPPTDIAGGLETRYLTVVTISGTLAGLSAAVPGIGTLIGLAVSGVESVFFLEMSALYAMAGGSVHGLESASPAQRRKLVAAVVLGESGTELLGKNASQSARDWAKVVGDKLPVVRSIDNPMVKRFLVRFLARRAILMFGKSLPAGLGAVIGALGNRALAKGVIANAHSAFGPPPATWPDRERETAISAAAQG
ncbi:hypothetical protein D7D52_05070 [Nocardia yunnanensis]|uniref:Di-and tripeptidase n=1 Tax=Nocardia yunnanensis TaxID=2382165 RepID=A0A386Z6J1_9NOCA|nr:hypothetical protein [Nocardia yunnanensis]AYF73338.1 hypothetical protein D7D52_05070 [Nocardia yunnanensis]